MLRDYLIVAYLTVVSVWPFTLPFIAVTAWWLFRIRWRIAGVITVALFVLIALAAWDFERYM